VPHDSVAPVAFAIDTGGSRIGVCADLGAATTTVMAYLKGCAVVYLESNHDPEMVLASSRPEVYKKRVLSRFGHLSNQDAARVLKEIAHPGLIHLYLAHLSKHCNTPERALQAAQEVIAGLSHAIEVSIAWQDKVSHKVHF
jgi:phosphoribosyl 1,2-cyclic phosphodiesterase